MKDIPGGVNTGSGAVEDHEHHQITFPEGGLFEVIIGIRAGGGDRGH